MKVIRTLVLEEHAWLRSEQLIRLLKILNSDGLKARMVGGCVRDALLGREIIDIDLACSMTPEETMVCLENAGVKVIPTGLKHGTITAVIDKRHFEITTLRQDVETYGRHAKVAFTDNWLDDAKRRDFTFNALYLDGDGSLYDPCDGINDLLARRVRFIGDANNRIQEDALRILRFFRFAAQIGDEILDPIGLESCIGNKDLIENLSGERLAQEIFKTLKAADVIPVLEIMAKSGILEKILPEHVGLEKFNDFVRLENELGLCDTLARLACLCLTDVSRHLKLSKKQSHILTRYREHKIIIRNDLSKKAVRKSIYKSGREVFIFALLQKGISGALLNYANVWKTPVFPLLGRDLLQSGFPAGPRLGLILKELETEWVEGDFSHSKNELLHKASLF